MYTVLPLTAALVGIVSAAPAGSKRDFSPDNVYYPLSNGFPNPNPAAVQKIQMDADGPLSNAPPPDKGPSADGITSLKLVAFNELFEVAYFNELIYNVTEKVPGYDLGYGHEYVIDALRAITAQEQLHALNANGGLKRAKVDQIEPCKYSFPVTDFQSAISLAATFTDIVLGTLQDVIQVFAKNGDDGLARGTASSLGNEGEQEGFFRLVQKKRPSAKPFLTAGVRDFAFTAVQGFTIPGSCPNIDTIPLKTFKPLTVESKDIKAETQALHFSFAKEHAGTEDWASLSVVFINGQTVPIVKSLDKVKVEGDTVHFEAGFPFDEFVMNGLTIAAVTKGSGPFPNAPAVAKEAIFGPGLIEIE
ncbi:hypothetical protein BDV95DRAFT_626997 [Massariosphaeria phaeospora]|uniref:Late sexual development protein n=1 Tax=Massariosphaeria phaeospora TaxID=100035 RepID=A0A7C8MDV8_9PLEO|nr:hypothetical protein BDV95DRAFT_626997 [Massariosphaeria phaeospora]